MKLIKYEKNYRCGRILDRVVFRFPRMVYWQFVGIQFRVSAFPMVTVWMFRWAIELSWAHREECGCDKCLPF